MPLLQRELTRVCFSITTGFVSLGCFLLDGFAYDFTPPPRPSCEEGGCRSTGSRGSELVAIVPKPRNISHRALLEEWTYKELPTFLLYGRGLASVTQPAMIKFELARESMQVGQQGTYEPVYETEFDLKPDYGITSFQLPEDAPGLEVGQRYRWRFSTVVNKGGLPESYSVQGLIQRKSLPSQFNEQLSAQYKMEWYAANGIWFDLVTELAQLRCQQPDNFQLKEKWDNLLQDDDVNLGQYRNQKLLDCHSL